MSDTDERPAANHDQAPDAEPAAEAPRLAGDDVRVGPEDSDEPQAGATEPTD